MRERSDSGVWRPSHDLYPVEIPVSDVSLYCKIDLLTRADAAARGVDARVREVQASLADEYKVVMIASSDGR